MVRGQRCISKWSEEFRCLHETNWTKRGMKLSQPARRIFALCILAACCVNAVPQGSFRGGISRSEGGESLPSNSDSAIPKRSAKQARVTQIPTEDAKGGMGKDGECYDGVAVWENRADFRHGCAPTVITRELLRMSYGI